MPKVIQLANGTNPGSLAAESRLLKILNYVREDATGRYYLEELCRGEWGWEVDPGPN